MTNTKSGHNEENLEVNGISILLKGHFLVSN